MSEIVSLDGFRAKEFEKLRKRKKDLEDLVHVCTVTYNAIIQIDDMDRFCFSSMVNRYLFKWKKELERVNFKLGIK